VYLYVCGRKSTQSTSDAIILIPTSLPYFIYRNGLPCSTFNHLLHNLAICSHYPVKLRSTIASASAASLSSLVCERCDASLTPGSLKHITRQTHDSTSTYVSSVLEISDNADLHVHMHDAKGTFKLVVWVVTVAGISDFWVGLVRHALRYGKVSY
jgi:hypothetical protein